tara:strand:+ start:49 stop:465 length:417 start_codon:yes stop_codon:yes gene_type:complete
MNKFEKKYGFKENEKTRAFHKSRRMFCIYKNKLHLAKPNLLYSHATWFEKEGWISEEKDSLMESIIRGMVDSKGDIYFYVGYDFKINNEAKFIFFLHLKELVKKLNLNANAKIFGGLIKQNSGKWPPRKAYGKIKDNL